MNDQDDVPYFGAPPEPEHYRPVRRTAPQRPPKRRILRSIVYSLLILLLVMLLLSPPVLNMITNNFPIYERVFPEKASFTVERRIVLSGTADYTIDLPKITDVLPAQRVTEIRYSPTPTESPLKYGKTWDVWRGSLGTFNREDIISIRVSMETETLVWEMERSGGTADIPQDLVAQYTGDEWVLQEDDTNLIPPTDDRDGDGRVDVMIEPSAPQISNLAQQLADDKPDVYSKAKAIYEYIISHFTYSTEQQMTYVKSEYGGLPKHTLATLRDGWGDCDEQAMLYISLLRTLGIPARLELGALYNVNENRWGGHAWALIYIPPEDGTSGNYWYNVDVVNSEFLIRDAYRFTTWIDDGNGTHLSDYYKTITYQDGFLQRDDEYISISFTQSGRVTVKTEQSMPGFEFALSIIAPTVAVILWRKRSG